MAKITRDELQKHYVAVMHGHYGIDQFFDDVEDALEHKLLGVARKILRSDQAEDAVQQAYIALTKNIQAGEIHLNIEAHLVAVTRNAAIDILRGVRRQRVLQSDLTADCYDLTRTQASSGWPDGLASTSERATLLRNAVSELRPALKEVVSYRVERDFDLTDVANHLGISYDTAKTRSRDALRALRGSSHLRHLRGPS